MSFAIMAATGEGLRASPPGCASSANLRGDRARREDKRHLAAQRELGRQPVQLELGAVDRLFNVRCARRVTLHLVRPAAGSAGDAQLSAQPAHW
jgi:hypothetical protein